jgi:8-oxo-dGTP pyrophosphatase MutT (NUDIX family)
MSTQRTDALAEKLMPMIETMTAENAMEYIAVAMTGFCQLASALETELAAVTKERDAFRASFCGGLCDTGETPEQAKARWETQAFIDGVSAVIIASELAKERDALRADLARVSEELGLPPTMGPAPGWLRQWNDDLGKTRKELAAERAKVECLGDALEYYANCAKSGFISQKAIAETAPEGTK